jgi:hypothetical protein
LKEGHIGEGGGFAALTFPEEAEETEMVLGEGADGLDLIGAGEKGV